MEKGGAQYNVLSEANCGFFIVLSEANCCFIFIVPSIIDVSVDDDNIVVVNVSC